MAPLDPPAAPSSGISSPAGGPGRPAADVPAHVHRGAEAVRRTADVIAQLRAPGGCAWTRAQRIADLWPYLLEEAHEAADAAQRGDWPALAEELGDVLLQVLYLADIAHDAGDFELATVARALEDKLVRRHPHVFAEQRALDPAAIAAQWEAIKAEERRLRAARSPAPTTPAGPLAGLPRSLPALLRAQRSLERTGAVPGAQAARAAQAALTRATAALSAPGAASDPDTLGQVLWASVRLCVAHGVQAEVALAGANAAFAERARLDPTAGTDAALDGSGTLWDEPLP